MWSDTFLQDDKWMKIRNVLPRPIFDNWESLSEKLKRGAVQKCAQMLMEKESTSSRIIDPLLREVTTGDAFEPEVSPEDIGRIIPKPIPLEESLLPIERADPGVPGEIVVDENGQLLKRYLNYTNFTLFLKESYDQWLVNELVPRIERQTIKLDEGVIRFKDVVLLSPTVAGGKKPLYPRMARDRGITYDLAIHATIVVQRDLGDGEIQEEIIGDKSRQRRLIGKIPLMLGSKRCYLHNLSPVELRQQGEDPSDPFGYFVVSGSEKVVLLHEKLRLNRIFVISKKKGKEIHPEINITVETLNGSARVNLIHEKNQQINFQTRFKADIRLPTGGKGKEVDAARRRRLNEEAKKRQTATSKKDGNYRYIGVEKLFYILRVLEELGPDGDFENVTMNTEIWPEIMTDKIMQFTKDEWKSKISLKSSILRLLYPSSDPVLVFQDIAIIKGGADISDFQSVKEVVLELIDREIFPQLNDLARYEIRNVYALKSDMLAMMIAKLIEVSVGLTPYDDRDSWSNKRLETASRAMNQLFSAIWRKYISAIKKNVAGKKIKNIPTAIMQEKPNITEIFESSFKGDNWGVQGSMRSNMTQKVNRDSVVSLYSHMHRVEVATNRNDKQPSIRMVHGTQYGYICPTESPEGQHCLKIGSLVETPEGPVKIELLKDGDKVICVNPVTHEREITEIYNHFTKPSEVFDLQVLGGKSIKATADHPFLAQGNDWKMLKDLRIGDQVYVQYPDISDQEFQMLAKYYDGKGFFLPITSIVSLGEDTVCDFTTVSDHHSFVSNGFVTHNCGIVKNLAVTAQVTYNKPDHDVILEILNRLFW